MYHSIRWRWLKKKNFKAETARDFVLAWDKAVNSMKGFRNLENKREEHMASQLTRLSKKYSSVLAILELERTEGILQRLGKPASSDI
jgi:pheromone shutdown protein TraB